MSKTPLYDGNDVSRWQGTIDWAAAKADGCQFAILRACYGDVLSYPGQVDAQFEYNYKECKRLGIPVGAYHYCYAKSPDEAKREAEGFLKLIAGKSFEMPLLYDVEEMSTFNTGKTNEIIKAWCDMMEANKYCVGIYIYRAAAQSYLSTETRNRYIMAIADYTTKDIFSVYNGPVGIWQNSSTSSRKGINGNVDHDYCYEDYPTIIKSKGYNGFTASANTKPEPTPSTKKANKEIADEVIAGKWDAGEKRKKLLTEAGYDYDAVQKIVNEKMSKKTKKKSIDEIAKEVIRGDWGVYPDRKIKLEAAGYNYDAVQKKVDEALRKK